MDIQNILKKAEDINGFIGAALVDYESGLCLGYVGGTASFDIELAAAGNSEIVHAKKKIRDQLGLTGKIEDILISLDDQYHLIRMLHTNKNYFVYVVLDRKGANLALARLTLKNIEKQLELG